MKTNPTPPSAPAQPPSAAPALAENAGSVPERARRRRRPGRRWCGPILLGTSKNLSFSSLRGATRRSNLGFPRAEAFLDCFATLAMTVNRGALLNFLEKSVLHSTAIRLRFPDSHPPKLFARIPPSRVALHIGRI